MSNLFPEPIDNSKELFSPLADRMRPKSLEDVINQKHVTERLKAFVKEKIEMRVIKQNG